MQATARRAVRPPWKGGFPGGSGSANALVCPALPVWKDDAEPGRPARGALDPHGSSEHASAFCQAGEAQPATLCCPLERVLDLEPAAVVFDGCQSSSPSNRDTDLNLARAPVLLRVHQAFAHERQEGIALRRREVLAAANVEPHRRREPASKRRNLTSDGLGKRNI